MQDVIRMDGFTVCTEGSQPGPTAILYPTVEAAEAVARKLVLTTGERVLVVRATRYTTTQIEKNNQLPLPSSN
ncbi:MAG TPA: hypothetical protein VGN72_09965 [Tepidisphaeraceae bacterium]|jgi:hypothetical protein|nr:hypothetical protein [Tepidisphaeraceae bacterium]